MQGLTLSLLDPEAAALAAEPALSPLLHRLDASLHDALARGDAVLELSLAELLVEHASLWGLTWLEQWLPPGFLQLCVRDETGHVHSDLERATGPGVVFCRVDLCWLHQLRH